MATSAASRRLQRTWTMTGRASRAPWPAPPTSA
uniref:Uncharacterized protein n=1 Tax=Arundo donax TaxID=35708 RepID=A0A0A8Z4M4_ARUDO